MEKAELVLITGMSGAGKTTAMGMFENLGYQCIDNYPIDLITEFVELISQKPIYHKVALAISLDKAKRAIKVLDNIDYLDITVVFLECDDETLIRRYKETRRAHPLVIAGKASSLSDAIKEERANSVGILPLTDLTIDSTRLKSVKLQKVIEETFKDSNLDAFRISFVSFGYKNGLPKDSDIVIDVRFLPNPFYIPEMRELTGNDEIVYNYVLEQEETQEFIKQSLAYFDYLFSRYHNEGKMHISVAIGCTGGQHRSVTLANYFYRHYKDYYSTYVLHRDALGKE